MSTDLSVNLNKIALLRNARGGGYPNLEYFGLLALKSGAKGLTLHPRPDQRHARYDDLYALKDLLGDFHDCELNIEGYPSKIFIDHVLKVRPAQCTLVPDGAEQITSDHGFDLVESRDLLTPVIKLLQEHGIRVSLFVDPNPDTLLLAAELGSERVELYTESWAKAFQTPEEEACLDRYRQAVQTANQAGLAVNAGHDLNLHNLARLLSIGNIREVSIGHALTVEALELGYRNVIKNYVSICQQG